MRACADGDLREQSPVPRAERVDDAVVAAGQPEDLPVCGHVPHVGAAAAADVPLLDDAARLERDDRDRALAAVRDIEEARTAARVEAVRAGAGRQEAKHAERAAV